MSTKQYPTAEYLRQCFRYEDGKLFWLKRPREHFPSQPICDTWNTRFANEEAGTLNSFRKRWAIRLNSVRYYRHRIIWMLHHGEWPQGELDHANRDSTDDRIENLRLATSNQNNANRGLTRRNTSGYKGVVQRSPTRWVACISVDNRNIYLGQFSNPELAHEAYLQAAKLYYGEFGFGNKV